MNNTLVDKLKAANLDIDEMVAMILEKDHDIKLIEKFKQRGVHLSTEEIRELSSLFNHTMDAAVTLDD